ncbi:DUF6049 family protein [Saccharomonospora azurea]|uniref:DUF6049 family protein n=1 Tax=Saccharomonospora azurea TaxID=40988 RepID=UPI002409B9F9|nr:DUF6049 family protein [Saccharomonospora azurea]
MRKLAAFGLALVFLAGQALFATPATPGSSGWAGLSGLPTAAAAPESDDVLRVRVDELTPRLVDTGTTEVTVVATVTNVGKRPVSDIVGRIQAGQRQPTAAALAQTLAEPPASESGWSPWVGVPGRLAPGEKARLRISAPPAALGLTEPGVYPLLLNVNGTPSSGAPARLAAVNLLMPVLGDAKGGTSTPLSMLWPIAAREPKVVSAPYDGQIVLADDSLAGELAPGGRLHSLVAAAESRRGHAALFGSLCYAVDPDLLETVTAMGRGYQVRTASGTVEGTGSESARQWLDQLRTLVQGQCVIETPYAGADLATLATVESDVDLVGEAVTNGATFLDVLNLGPMPGVVWSGGRLTPSALSAAADAGATTVITGPGHTSTDGASDTSAGDSGVDVVTYDTLVAAGFGHATSRGGGSGQPRVATQNAVAAVALRGGLSDEAGGGPVLMAPPHNWNVTGDDLTAMLDSLAELHGRQLVHPVPVPEMLETGTGGATQSDTVAGRAADTSARPLPDDLVSTLSDIESTLADFQAAMSVDPTRQVEPVNLVRPLHNAVIRATSASWRDTRAQRKATEAAVGQVRQLTGRVSVTTPSQPVSLASGSSPLPVTLSNDLPVAVTVRIKLTNSPGLRPSRIEDTPLAANSRVSRFIPAETLRSGRFMVNVSLTTPTGTTLGHAARMELTSTEFGVVTVVLTATAGAALVFLSGRQIYRRVKTRGEEHG